MQSPLDDRVVRRDTTLGAICAATVLAFVFAPNAMSAGQSRQPVSLSGYRALFAFIAMSEGLPGDDRTILTLAADSSIEVRTPPESEPLFYVVKVHFLAGGLHDRLRGSGDNGNFYVVRSHAVRNASLQAADAPFELVGKASGNTFRWQEGTRDDGRRFLRFVVSERLSGQKNVTHTYTWNGNAFE